MDIFAFKLGSGLAMVLLAARLFGWAGRKAIDIFFDGLRRRRGY